MEILTSLRLRSVGQNRKKAQSFSGISGISFLKSREMAEEMYAAMCCRGFVGEYKTQKTSTFLESSFDDRSNRNIHLFRGSVEITRSNQSSIKEGKRPFNPNI